MVLRRIKHNHCIRNSQSGGYLLLSTKYYKCALKNLIFTNLKIIFFLSLSAWLIFSLLRCSWSLPLTDKIIHFFVKMGPKRNPHVMEIKRSN